jgi:hypothetical protein
MWSFKRGARAKGDFTPSELLYASNINEDK